MLFTLTIFAAMAIGMIFPFRALTLMPYGFVFFFALMVFAGLSLETRPRASIKPLLPALILGLFLCFVFLPLLQISLARLLLEDQQYLAGIYFASLAPVAIVAPFFTRMLGGDEEFSHLLMIASSALYPFVAFGMLLLMPLGSLPLDLLSLAKGMLLLVIFPVAVSFFIKHFFPKVPQQIRGMLPVLNSVCLGALVFILFGSAAQRLNFSYSARDELLKLVSLGFFQDFGVLGIASLLLPQFFPTRIARALAVSLSLKNTAIAASLLLFYSPNSAMPATLIFFPHALLFGLLSKSCFFFKKDLV